MKKLSLALALILTLSALAACGSGEEETTTAATSGSTPVSTTAADSTAPVASSTPDASSGSATPETSETPTTTSTPETNPAPATTEGTTEAETTTTTPATTTEVTPPTADNPAPSYPADAKKVGTADELADLFYNINTGIVPEDVYIVLTADIDLSGMKDTVDWEPVYRFSGTFDGAGHTISGLNWTFKMQNGGGDMPDANQHGSYIINEYAAATEENSRAAEATIGLLFLKTENATLKNFTFKDSKLNLICTYNKNYQMFIGGVVGWMEGGSITDVKLENVDLPAFGYVGYNQKLPCYAGLVAGAADGTATLENVEVDKDCLLDASGNVKMDVASFVGKCFATGTLTLKKCSTAATVKAGSALIESTADISKLEGAGANIGTQTGGHAAAYVAYEEEGAKVTTTDCTSTAKLTGV